MVTKIYCIRHAEAEGNLNETFQGMTEALLTEKGSKQIICLSERFRPIPLQALYSSPIGRAYKTAEALNLYHGLPIQTEYALHEIHGGAWEGLSWNEIPKRFPKEYESWTKNLHAFAAPQGEAVQTVYNRMQQVFLELAERHVGQTIAVVSHGCALRCLLSWAEFGTLDEIGAVGWSDNTAVSLLEISNGVPKLIYKNDSSHLPPVYSTLRTSKWCLASEEKGGSSLT